MTLDELVKEKREDILKLAAKHGARNVRVFGSVARGEAGPESDIDLLVDMEPGRSLLDLGGLWSDLNELLGRKVDVVTEKSIYWLLRRRILKEARPLSKTLASISRRSWSASPLQLARDRAHWDKDALKHYAVK